MRCLTHLFVLLLAAGVYAGEALADYPDYTASAPPGPGVRSEVGAVYAESEEPNRATEMTDTSSAEPRRIPLRMPPPEHQQAAAAGLASDVQPIAQRPGERDRAIQLAPQTAESRPAQRASEMPPLLTASASLGIVLGLFLLVAWAVRRGMPKSAAFLPREAFEILGRAPLVGRQQAHLVRCGNKVLLLSISATTVETLTEITDPAEVDRLAGICNQHGATRGAASFRQVLGQFRHRDLEYLARAGDEPDFEQLELGIRERTAGGAHRT
jgi:flagellar biogenesis protein FliO